MKKFIMALVIMVLSLSAFASERVQVTLSRIYDGDTIEVINEQNLKENIRLIGIDCFETKEIHRAYTQAYKNKMSIVNKVQVRDGYIIAMTSI